MENIKSKKDYLEPKVKVVSFKVEDGFQSGGPTLDGLAHTNDLQEGTEFDRSYFDYSF